MDNHYYDGMHENANQGNINMVEDIADKNRCVLVIGLDGLRSDALKKSWENRKTPAIDRLIQKGSYNFNTQANSNHTWSATGWSTVHTGVWMNKHGVTSNSWSGSNFTKYPTLMKRAEEYNPSLRTLSIVQWAPINDKLVEGIDMERNMTTDEGVTTEIIKELDGSNSNDPWFVFLQFSNIDYAGHDSGYGPDKPAYMKAIEETDARIYRVLDALERRAARKSEEWLIIVTTDHGGIGRGHGGSSPEERTIFTVVSGEFAHRGEMIPNQNQYINQTDVMVTALNYLGVPIQENWSLDGRVVGIKTVFKDEDFACYIDPNEGPRVRITTQHSKQVETLTWSLNSSPIFGYGINNGRYTRNLAATDKGEYFQIYDHWNLNNYADVNGKYYFKFKKYYASGRMVVHEFEYNPVTGIVKYDNSTYSHGSEFSFRFFENNKQKVLITTTHSEGVYNRLLQTVTWQLNNSSIYGYGVQLGRYRYDLEVVDKGSYYEINDYWNIKNYQKINGKYYLKFINYYSNGKRTYYEYEYHPSATQIKLVTEVEQSFSLPNLIDAVRDSHRFNQWKKASNIYYTNGVYFQGLFPYVLNNVEKYRVSINNNAPIIRNRYNPDSNGRIEINFLEYNGGYGVAKGTLITIWAITPVGDVIKVFEDRTI